MDYRKNGENYRMYFGITISPPPRFNSAKALYIEDKYVIQRELNKVSHRYILYPEFDNKARLHYHGFILIHDKTKWNKQVKHVLDKTLGYTLLSTFKNFKSQLGWLCYCRKEYTPDNFSPIFYKSLKYKTVYNVPEYDEGICKYFKNSRTIISELGSERSEPGVPLERDEVPHRCVSPSDKMMRMKNDWSKNYME